MVAAATGRRSITAAAATSRYDTLCYAMPNGEEAIASLIIRNINGHHQPLNPETINTCYALRIKARKKKGRRSISVYYDIFFAGHEWLLDGWVAEKKTTPSSQHWVTISTLVSK
ncbi:hypothetical protein ACFX1R_041883 [Malus domestica]